MGLEWPKSEKPVPLILFIGNTLLSKASITFSRLSKSSCKLLRISVLFFRWILRFYFILKIDHFN